MSQGRKKVTFSVKGKKAQLLAKKQKKFVDVSTRHGIRVVPDDDVDSSSKAEMVQLNRQPGAGEKGPNSYVLQVCREMEADFREKKKAARKTIVHVPESGLEINIDDYFMRELDFPKRPSWNFDMSREELEAREHRYITDYITSLEIKFGWKDLNVEYNPETWRQLWRVLEMSDIVLIITDIRYCALQFPPSVYEFVTEKLHKEMILVLNKIDLASAPLVVAWKQYFKEKYPSLHIVTFTSFPSYNLRGNLENKAGLEISRRKDKLRMAAEGAKTLMEACKDIVKDEVDLSSWSKKISEDMELEFNDGEAYVEMKKVDTSYVVHEKYKDGVLTIGCIGQPNVGKSSLMNSIMGKKVVSVSKTPRHTNHFQTIFLTSNVRLCDCPGLVFPSKVPKALQVLMGSFPITQLREPYSSVQYLAERLDLVRLLKLQHPENDEEWSAMDICDGWALKQRFYTFPAGRPDSRPAAKYLLRMALDGKICLNLHPPNFTNQKEYWENNAEVQTVRWIRGESTEDQYERVCVSSEEEEEENAKALEADDAETPDIQEEDSSDSDSSDTKAAVGISNKFAALVDD